LKYRVHWTQKDQEVHEHYPMQRYDERYKIQSDYCTVDGHRLSNTRTPSCMTQIMTLRKSISWCLGHDRCGIVEVIRLHNFASLVPNI